MGGDRLDAFLVKVPAELLQTSTTMEPAQDPAGLSVTAIQPNVVKQGAGTVRFVVTGTGFAPGIALALEGGEGPSPRVRRVTFDSATQLTADIEIRTGGPSRDRFWDVRATNPDGSNSVAVDLLRITP